MSKKHNFLAFDCGATSGRAVLATVGDGEFEMREIHRFLASGCLILLYGRQKPMA